MNTTYYTEYDVTSGKEKAMSFTEQFPSAKLDTTTNTKEG